MKIQKRLFYAIFAALLLGLCSLAQARRPIPVTPAERAFFQYLEELSNITLADNIPADPWVECDDQDEKSTFFSASFNQFSDPNKPGEALQDWITSLLDHAYWARVRSANCIYEANYFNECFARGRFRVMIRSKRIIGFKVLAKEQYCNASHSPKN